MKRIGAAVCSVLLAGVGYADVGQREADEIESSFVNVPGGTLTIVPTLADDFESGLEIESDDGGEIELELENVQANGAPANVTGAQLELSGTVNGDPYSQTFLFDISQGDTSFEVDLGLSVGDVFEFGGASLADAGGVVFARVGLTGGEDGFDEFEGALVEDADSGDWSITDDVEVELDAEGEFEIEGKGIVSGTTPVTGSGTAQFDIVRDGIAETVAVPFTVTNGVIFGELEVTWTAGSIIEVQGVRALDNLGQTFGVLGVLIEEGFVPDAEVAREIESSLVQDADLGDWTFDESTSEIEIENDESGEFVLELNGVTSGTTLVNGTATLEIDALFDGVPATESFAFSLVNGSAELDIDFNFPAGTVIEGQLDGIRVLDSLGQPFAVPGLVIGEGRKDDIELSLVADSDTGDATFDTGSLDIDAENSGDVEFNIRGVEDSMGQSVTGLVVLSISGIENGVAFTRTFDVTVTDGNGRLESSLDSDDGARLEIDSVEVSLAGSVFAVPGIIINVGSFLRGDATQDGSLSLADPIETLATLFNGVPGDCLLAMDADDNDELSLVDVIAVLTRLFANGPPLTLPDRPCGSDQTPGLLTCDVPGCP